MKALLWKEIRINRLVLLVGAGLLVVPYVVAGIVVAVAHWRGWTPGPGQQVLTMAAVWSLGLSWLTVAVLGGNAVAGERADRSAEFLAMLPCSRREIVAGKVVVTVAASLLIWALNLLVIFAVAPHVGPVEDWVGREIANMRDTGLVMFAPMSILSFGIAWLLSAAQRSPSVAAMLGLAAPLIGWVLVLATVLVPGMHVGGGVMVWTAVAIGLVSFVVGVVWYLRQVEP